MGFCFLLVIKKYKTKIKSMMLVIVIMLGDIYIINVYSISINKKYIEGILYRKIFFLKTFCSKFKTKKFFLNKSNTVNKFSAKISINRSEMNTGWILFWVKIESKFNIVNKIRIIPNRIYFFLLKHIRFVYL
ncbi:hypothetical protein BFS07_14715 [Clostridium perfringens]|nr:hypothetical protein BFS07_14715 [Clostridium perfringens]